MAGVLSTASSIQKHETYLHPIITTHCQSLRMAIARQHDINNRINAKLPPLATYCEASTLPGCIFQHKNKPETAEKMSQEVTKTRHVRTRRHGKQGREVQGKSMKVRQPAQAHRRRKRLRACAGARRCESSSRSMQGQARLDQGRKRKRWQIIREGKARL